MLKDYRELTTKKIIGLPPEGSGQPVKDLSREFDVSKIFLAAYLKALEELGYIKGVGPTKVYFKEKAEG